jgi:hypothetical protein
LESISWIKCRLAAISEWIAASPDRRVTGEGFTQLDYVSSLFSGNGPAVYVTPDVPFVTVGVIWAMLLNEDCWVVCVESEDELGEVVVEGLEVVVEGVEVATETAGVVVADVCAVAAVDGALVDGAVLDGVEVVLVVVDDGMTDSQSTVILLPSMFADLDADMTVFCDVWLVVTDTDGSNRV